jgi:PAS domain S-box-containing protein
MSMSSKKWKTGLDKAHAENLPLLFTAMLCVQIVVTLRVPMLIGWDLPLWLILSDAILILINVGLVLWIRTESPSEKLYYPLATFAYLCVGVRLFTAMIAQEIPLPFDLAILMLGGSLCFLSVRHLVFSMALIILGWVAITLPMLSVLSVAEITSTLVVPLIGAALGIYVQHWRILSALQALEVKHHLATLLKQKAQSELQSQAIVDNAVDGIITIDEQGNVKSFNPAAKSLFGYSAGEVIGQNIKMLMPEPYHSEHDSYLSNYRNTGDKKMIGIGREVVARRKDGSTFPIDLGMSETQTSEGRMFTGIVRDITARRAIEEELNLALQTAKESEERLRSVLENAVDGIITINDSGLLESFNPAAEYLFGYSAGEVIGQNIKMLMAEPYHSEHDSYLSNHRNTGDKKIIGIDREVVARRKDGSTFPIDLRISETQTSEGHMSTGIVCDMTARKAIEEELNLALQAAESSSKAKASFLANMSHEIRTPMSGVISMAELLEESQLNDDQAKILRTIRDSGHSLLVIINDILDISKIEAGMLSLERIEMSLADIVEGVVSALSVAAAAADIKLVTSIESELPAKVLGDPFRLRQILLNLLGNAIKFSKKGGEVILRAEQINVSEQDDEVEVCFTVSDQGIGMSKEGQKTLFAAFTQAEVSTTRKYGGTGLGLSICQRLVEMMGGSIDVKSEMGKGSTFSINLVFKVVTETMERTESAGNARPQVQINDGVENAGKTEVSVPTVEEALSQGRLILVAEDNVVNQDIIRRQLTKLGYQCEIASDGKEALAMWQKKHYGIVLTDCQMPEVDGYELTQTIRKEEKDKDKKRTPIIAITGNALVGDAEHCLAAGMDDFLSKPLKMEALRRILIKWMPREKSKYKSANEATVGGDESAAIQPKDSSMTELNKNGEAINERALKDIFGEDEVTFKEILDEFIEPTRTIIQEIHKGYSEKSAEEIKQASHKLKSAALSVGAEKLGELGATLESAAGIIDWETIDAGVSEIDGLMQKVEAYIREI